MERQGDGSRGREIARPATRRSHLARGCAAVLCIAALIAGCGSYTKGDFVARADAICAGAVRQTRLIPPPSFTGASRRQLSALADYVSRVLPIAASEAQALAALRRPGGSAHDQAILARYLKASDQAIRDYRALAAAARARDAQGVASAEAALRASPVASLAADYGLRACGAPGATVR